jgi:hypothetical protein
VALSPEQIAQHPGSTQTDGPDGARQFGASASDPLPKPPWAVVCGRPREFQELALPNDR